MNKKEQQTISRICLGIMPVMCFIPWLAIWQTHYQVVSPLVPVKIIEDITYPYRVASVVMPVLTVVLFLFYLKKKYRVVIAGVIITVVAWKVCLL